MSSLTVDRSTDSKRKADDSFDTEAGMVVRLLKPIVTSRPAPRIYISCTDHEQQKYDFLQDIVKVTAESQQLLPNGDSNDCETPKSEKHKIPKVLECPLAPRKPRLKPRMNTSSLLQRFFFSPPDLDSVFTVYRKSPPRKKIRRSKRISALAI